jgi:hypothetical protein
VTEEYFEKLFCCALKYLLHEVEYLSNSKLRVFAIKAFRSEKSTETTDNSTEVSNEINVTFESISMSPKFRFWENL